jgi:DNA-binding response OmpR family regulator
MLSRRGYEVWTARNSEEARKVLASSSPDIIVLDIRLPDGNGIELCREIQTAHSSPILFISGLDEDEDIMAGLDSGGDDYLTKPFEFGVLVSRIEALLRRAARVPGVVTKGRLSLDVTANTAALDGADLLLTQKEFALLLIFAQNDGRFISAEYLYEKIWKAPLSNSSDALKSSIKRLRGKIEDSGWQIEWSRGEGYIFERE